MKAYLRSVRIAPKKANIIAKMVRGMPVSEALTLLQHTNKKGARLVEKLLQSAVANARHNDKQHPTDLVIKTIVVNQGMGLPRGVPMARGRIRSMMKFMSHIDLTLGIGDGKTVKSPKTPAKSAPKASQKPSNRVKESPTKAASHDSSESQAGMPASDTPLSSPQS